MRQVAIGVALALATLAPRAQAQPAFAIGHPLPAADLDNGTVSVRVIAGSVGEPVTDAEVTLVVAGKPQVAHTDSAGRAFFKELPPGTKVKATITGADKQEMASDEFAVPPSGGIKVMLSTKPMQAGQGGAPFAGGAGGMPEPRQLSGQPRPEKADPPGTYTVRLTYDDLKDPRPPAGVTVTLVGYTADDRVLVVNQQTDAEGRAQFTSLDRSGATSYFAFAELPRAGSLDRLVTQPVVMLPQAGLRVILSSEKRDSTAPPIDDLVSPGEVATPAGKVRIALGGLVQPRGDTVEIIDAATKQVVARGTSEPGPPDPSAIQGGAPITPRPNLPPGTLVVDAHGGIVPALDPLPHVRIRVVDAKAQSIPADAPTAETGADGATQLTVPTVQHKQNKAILTINGKDFEVPPFDIWEHGAEIHITAQWASSGAPEAVLDLPANPNQVLYAQITTHNQTFRSRPFQLVEGRGVRVLVQALPRVMFSFSWTSHADDEFFAVQGRFEVRNNSWAPYAGGRDGLMISLPKGFKGGILAEQDQGDVAVVPDEGFRIVRPLPPGERKFLGGFSLPVDNGTVDWSLDLPFGAYESGIEIADLAGMDIKLPPGVRSEPATDSRGTWRVLPNITILPRQSMAMTISGLPTKSPWRVWMPRLVGVLVIVLMVGGLTLALVRARRDRATDLERAPREARRKQLLDELVELEAGERTPKQNRRREAVLAELERLWDG